MYITLPQYSGEEHTDACVQCNILKQLKAVTHNTYYQSFSVCKGLSVQGYVSHLLTSQIRGISPTAPCISKENKKMLTLHGSKLCSPK